MGKHNIGDQVNFPYLGDPRLRLFATGSWDSGGVVEFLLREKTLDLIELPTVEWASLALLIESAKFHDADPWLVAFKTAKSLAGELQRRAHRGSGLANDMHRAIHRLRKLLSHSHAATLQNDSPTAGSAWAKQIIQYRPKFGYRLGLVAPQLELLVLTGDFPRNSQS